MCCATWSWTSSTDRPADGVVDGISGRGGDDEQPAGQPDVERAGRGPGAGGEQQRVAGQERRDNQAGLAEHDDEQDGVDPRPVTGDEFEQVGIDVEQKIDQLGHE